ncbi:LysR family transcriptional regulator [Azospirillum sp. TSO35-2]|uniref:LysR family transcriptional regulator n=1 Tax=Azospirillum sp. TSO35-2 TaxID=716796 RepID=UPI001304D58D|nr:LysR family transcriptional regulator [Azospirillum sp. TSO35-2]
MLRQFVAVAEELHFGRAAARLNMAQPPLSQAIKQLEILVGVQLLQRTKRFVRLTPAGSVLLEHARDMLAQEARAIESARLAAQGLIGRISIGFVGSVAYALLPRLLQDFRSRFPNIQVDLREATSKEQVESLLSRKIDVGIVRLPLPNVANLQVRVIERERFIAVLPAFHHLAAADSVILADLAEESFMIFPADRIASLHSKFLFACHEAGFTPRITLEAWQMPSMVSLVAAGFGTVLLPSQVRSLGHPGVVYKDINDASTNLDLEIAVVWRDDNMSAGVHSFLSVADPAAR